MVSKSACRPLRPMLTRKLRLSSEALLKPLVCWEVLQLPGRPRILDTMKLMGFAPFGNARNLGCHRATDRKYRSLDLDFSCLLPPKTNRANGVVETAIVAVVVALRRDANEIEHPV